MKMINSLLQHTIGTDNKNYKHRTLKVKQQKNLI